MFEETVDTLLNGPFEVIVYGPNVTSFNILEVDKFLYFEVDE